MDGQPQGREDATAAGRGRTLDRALRNFLETFPLFAAVVLAAHATDTHNALTEWGTQLYFRARVAYVPSRGCLRSLHAAPFAKRFTIKRIMQT